ncbi:unnamed protein product [Effrenium voratum]|nr:unnamed protein product [Effrenium voratum]
MPWLKRRRFIGSDAGHGHCCRKPWTWAGRSGAQECGEHCAQEQCKRDVALAWYPVDDKQEHYKCCPEMTMDSPGMSVEEEVAQVGMFPEVLTVGSSWVSRPIDLSGSTLGGILVGVLAVLLWLMWLCSAPVQHHQRHVQKDH